MKPLSISIAIFLLTLLGFTELVGSNVTPNWRVFKSTDSASAPQRINSKWVKIERNRIREGFNPSPTWVKLDASHSEKDTLEYYWVLSNSFIDTVDYWQNGRHLFQTGLAFPFAQRPFEAECFILPVKIPPNAKVELFSRFAIRSGTLSTQFHLFNKSELDKWLSARNRFNLIYLGVVFNVMLIALVVSIMSGRAIMFFYAIYLAAFLLFQSQTLGYAYRYFWPEIPFLAFFGKGIFQLIACYLFWVFNAMIAGFSKNENLISIRFRKVFLLLPLFSIALAIAFYSFSIYHAITWVVVISCILLILPAYLDLLVCVIKRFRPSYGVFAAMNFPMLAAISIMLRGAGLLPDWIIIDNAYPICYMAEVVFILVFTIYFMRRQNRFLLVQEKRFHYHQEYLRSILPEMKLLQSREEVQRVLSAEVKVSNSYPIELLEKDFEILQKLVHSKKLWASPDFNMHSLSNEAGLPFNRASKAINTLTKKNFAEWINEFRVEESKRLLQDSETSKYTIEAIGEMAGFGSRSSFYSVFKRFTGFLPTEYKGMKGS